MNETNGGRQTGLVGRAAAMYSRRQYGKSLEPVDAYACHPRLMMGYGAFEFATEHAHKVDQKLKDLGVIKAAAMVGCEWCMDFGSHLGSKQGVTEQQLRDLPRFEESDAFSPLEKLVLRLAQGMTRTPAEVSDELRAELREHFSEAQLVEVVSAIAIENYRARSNDALGLASQGFSEGAVCVMPERPAAHQQAEQAEAAS